MDQRWRHMLDNLLEHLWLGRSMWPRWFNWIKDLFTHMIMTQKLMKTGPISLIYMVRLEIKSVECWFQMFLLNLIYPCNWACFVPLFWICHGLIGFLVLFPITMSWCFSILFNISPHNCLCLSTLDLMCVSANILTFVQTDWFF